MESQKGYVPGVGEVDIQLGTQSADAQGHTSAPNVTQLLAGTQLIGSTTIQDPSTPGNKLKVNSDGSTNVNATITSGGGGGPVTAVSGAFVDGSIVTIGTEADTAVVSPTSSATVIALLKGLLTELVDIEAQQVAGQTTMAGSQPVVLASNQSAIPVTASAGTNLNTSALALESGGNLASIVSSLANILTQVTNHTVTANAGTNLNTSPLALESGGNLATVVSSLASILTQVTNHTVTANAGTNLNTSTLALESGGNLATVVTNTNKIPSQGAATAASSMPVIDVGQQGWIAATGTGTITTDDSLTFASQVRTVVLYNTSANPVPIEFDQTSAATSFPIQPGQYMVFDKVLCTVVHVFPSATLPINTTAGLYVKGWKA